MAEQIDSYDEGIDYYKKYEFFVLSLSFTVLGFSIQTANFKLNLISCIFEISAWIFLLFSGINALKRIQGLSGLFFIFSSHESAKEAEKKNKFEADAKVQYALLKNSKKTISLFFNWIYLSNNCKGNYSNNSKII